MEEQPAKPRRIWRILLVVSLALNLLVIGVVAGAVMRFGGGDRFGGPPPRGGLIYFREMPRAAQKDIRAAAREGFRSRDEDRAAQMVDVLDVLRAAPFVAADLRDIMATQSQAFQANQMRLTDIWIGHLEVMTDEERRAYADRVEKAAKRPHHIGKPPKE